MNLLGQSMTATRATLAMCPPALLQVATSISGLFALFDLDVSRSVHLNHICLAESLAALSLTPYLADKALLAVPCLQPDPLPGAVLLGSLPLSPV